MALELPVALASTLATLPFTRKPRGSWSAREHFIVRMLQRLLGGVVGQGPEVQRRVLAELRPALPKGIHETEEQLGRRDAWRWTPDGADPTAVLLHFHGGGYVIGHPLDARAWCCSLAQPLGIPVVSLDYRLCPEHPHPAAQEDGEAAVHALVEAGIAPERIVLTGDSAGGGVALGVLRRLQAADGPRVAGAVLGSPVVTLASTADSWSRNAEADMLVGALVREWNGQTGAATDDPSLSHLLADLTGLPPLRFLVGDAELFHDDVLACAQLAERGGVDVQTLVGVDGVHCWYKDPLLPGQPAGTEAVVELVRGLL